MIGLDTNVVVRYLTQDHAAQSKRATEAIENAVDRGDRIFLSGVVLCELVWVLEGAYGYKRGDIAVALEHILRTAQFDFDHKDQIWQAWQDYRTGKGDFADYLIGRIGQAAGCSETLTFDRSLRESSLFRLM
jgi:predicted nucleic-acid-binding protein